MNQIKPIYPPDFGWLEKKLSDQEIKRLWEYIDNRGRSVKDTLAGHIHESNALIDKDNWFFKNTLENLCNSYAESFYNIGDDIPTTNRHPYFLQTMWVNYQKQTEFNPTHIHKGVYSFVIWMKIPTEYNEQKENPIAKNTNLDVISNFSFNYKDIIGEHRYYTYEMSKKMEGLMLFFPSKLTHSVYPFFNCPENRISISGNIFLNTNIIM